jgi:Flp pilus assembly protein TadB
VLCATSSSSRAMSKAVTELWTKVKPKGLIDKVTMHKTQMLFPLLALAMLSALLSSLLKLLLCVLIFITSWMLALCS